MRENALLVTGDRERIQGNFRLHIFRVPDISGKQDLPRLAVPGRRESHRDPLRAGRRGRIPGNHRDLLERHQQSNSPGRLCERTRREEQDERDRQARLSRPPHRAVDDSDHPTTNERRETLQDERLQGRVLLHGEKRRPERHIRELPGRRQGRRAESDERAKK